MDERTFDLQSARNLFSKARQVSFGFKDNKQLKTPFVRLQFKSNDNKQAHAVFNQLSGILNNEKLKLSVNENGGEYLSVSFLWESRGVVFSSIPDRYNRRECQLFRKNAFYEDAIKLFLSVETEDNEIIVTVDRNGTVINNLDVVYYEFLP